MKLNLLFLILFIASSVSANGLGIVGENTFYIEKNESVNSEFQVTIQNQDSFTFYNITLDESIASMDKIEKLESGQSVNVTVTLSEDTEFDGKLKFIGEYEASLGASSMTEVVEVSYEDGIDKCDISLIKGDSVVWRNSGLDQIRLKDVNTNEYFATIPQGENETRLFSEPIVLEYVAVWIVPFTEICTIEVLNDEGLIHNSDYDAEINLKLNLSYKQTTIETTFLSTSYSMDYNQHKSEEHFLIRNTGSETARGITLSSDWITFEQNNFDLLAGDSINVEYSITPMVRETNQTNKTYVKTILIEGNFPSIEDNVSIYVNYANLDEIIETSEVNEEWAKKMITLSCYAFPDLEECKKTVSYYNGSGGSTIELNEESFRLFLEKYGEDLIKEDKSRKNDTEFKANISSTLIKVENELSEIKNETKTTNETSKSASNTALFLVILLSASVVLVIAGVQIKKQIRKNKIEKDYGISTEEDYD